MSAPLISYNVYFQDALISICSTLRQVKKVKNIYESYGMVDLIIVNEERHGALVTRSLVQLTELDKIKF